MPSTSRLVGVGLLALLVLVALMPTVARAHATLLSTSPRAGQQLGTAPGVVVLQFSQPLDPRLSRVTVTDPAGARVAGKASGTEARVALATNQPGTYRVAWTAVSTIDLLIDQTAPDTWLDQLSADRQDKIREVFAARQKDNAEIGLLQCCNLDDRLTVAAKLGLWRHTWLPSRKAFDRWTRRLKGLRDTLAHGGGLLDAEPSWAGAIELLKDVRRFADQLWAAAHPEP